MPITKATASSIAPAAKGDLVVGSATNDAAVLGVGSNDQVLTADSSTSTGVKWATPGGGNPAGTVIFYAANTAPTGFLKANGAAISRSTYATLFSAIGTTFGVGDGSTTFNVPDLRGYFPRGWADNGSIDSGRTFGSTQASTTINGGADEDAEGSYVVQNVISNNDGTDGTATVKRNTNSGNLTATRNKIRPVNLALLACIKF